MVEAGGKERRLPSIALLTTDHNAFFTDIEKGKKKLIDHHRKFFSESQADVYESVLMLLWREGAEYS